MNRTRKNDVYIYFKNGSTPKGEIIYETDETKNASVWSVHKRYDD